MTYTPPVPKIVTVTVDLDVNGSEISEIIERVARYAFHAGHSHGVRAAGSVPLDHLTREQAYTDWRGWGPGALLPGGTAFREAAETQEAHGLSPEQIERKNGVLRMVRRTPCNHTWSVSTNWDAVVCSICKAVSDG